MDVINVSLPDKWAMINLDLIEENLEKHDKALVILSGASSSGKTYCANILSAVLKRQGYNPLVISLDAYNFGLSGIIPNKVNEHYFDSKIKRMKEISSEIKKIIEPLPFENKYLPSSLDKISAVLDPYFADSVEKEKFVYALGKEWEHLNFDEPSVYDLKEASEDILSLLDSKTITKKEYSKVTSERVKNDVLISGSEVDVIIVEGIYALHDDFLASFDKDNIITNFIDSNPKTLFLRRILRDKKGTSAPTAFTVKLYFDAIVPSYINTILPSKKNANVVYNNDMTFAEMRSGTLYKRKMEMFTKELDKVEEFLKECKILQTTYEKDTYLSGIEENEDDKKNILRLRSYSFDGGKTYIASSLVHKGVKKARKDGIDIRPINVLIQEGELQQVFKSEMNCLESFAMAGFLIGPMLYKIKYNVKYKGQMMTIRKILSYGYYIEFDEPVDDEIINCVKSRLA